ncbi:MAG TPA: MarR family transcriptional regulator [Steroidobacteraceae bacterium]|jgi:predicted nucleotidyltransferase|nr:MarR family transcriptional regulator [Steroidobacteraceae bacterium]
MLIMHQSVTYLLFPGYRRRVLALLLLHPEQVLHGREIARRTGLPAGTLTRELNRLAGAGLLKQERRGNQVLYSANRESPIHLELASILRKTTGLASVVAESLEPQRALIKVALIFGSVARGAETSESDVDVLIVGSPTFGAVVESFDSAQKQLLREINPKVFSVREWKAKLKQKNSFVAGILGRPKIFLIGTENDLAELAGDQP